MRAHQIWVRKFACAGRATSEYRIYFRRIYFSELYYLENYYYYYCTTYCCCLLSMFFSLLVFAVRASTRTTKKTTDKTERQTAFCLLVIFSGHYLLRLAVERLKILRFAIRDTCHVTCKTCIPHTVEYIIYECIWSPSKLNGDPFRPESVVTCTQVPGPGRYTNKTRV